MISGCDTENHCDNDYCSEEGVITGADPRDCICCGGWFIKIGEKTWRVWSLPESFIQDLENREYPVPVYLEWSPSENPCLGDEITVECIRKRS